MTRRLLALAVLASAAVLAAPAHAIVVCDSNRTTCVYVDDPVDTCPPNTTQVVRLPRPNGGNFLLVCGPRR